MYTLGNGNCLLNAASLGNPKFLAFSAGCMVQYKISEYTTFVT